mmetsp:Transcript_130256/g.230171  ORF Transcript_130256/g.230171 Transcript_130256/m.230171 type:complete len:268 (-) Transcript_130256:208-1011(-)
MKDAGCGGGGFASCGGGGGGASLLGAGGAAGAGGGGLSSGLGAGIFSRAARGSLASDAGTPVVGADGGGGCSGLGGGGCSDLGGGGLSSMGGGGLSSDLRRSRLREPLLLRLDWLRLPRRPSDRLRRGERFRISGGGPLLSGLASRRRRSRSRPSRPPSLGGSSSRPRLLERLRLWLRERLFGLRLRLGSPPLLLRLRLRLRSLRRFRSSSAGSDADGAGGFGASGALASLSFSFSLAKAMHRAIISSAADISFAFAESAAADFDLS